MKSTITLFVLLIAGCVALMVFLPEVLGTTQEVIDLGTWALDAFTWAIEVQEACSDCGTGVVFTWN